MIMRVLFDGEEPEGPEPLPEPLLGPLLEAAPRVTLEAGGAWLDVRGLDETVVHATLHRSLAETGLPAGAGLRCGAGTRPVVAAVAAGLAAPGDVLVVEPGDERDFLAEIPLAVLGVPEPLLGWLADVGVQCCGELAAVEREAVEVRFGGGAVEWWRLARGDDERRLFRPVPLPHPHASVDFIDYVVTDPERLIFSTNALLGSVCEELAATGSHARRLRLRLPLANGGVWERTLKAARPTADRAAWLRLARGLLERLTVPDSVAGIAIEVETTEAASAVQGDLFDAGFATASAVETALGRLLEDQGSVVRLPRTDGHPLAEMRGEFHPVTLQEVTLPGGAGNAGKAGEAGEAGKAGKAGKTDLMTSSDTDVMMVGEPVGLTLQLLDEPRAVTVETARRRDHHVPVRYRDGGWHVVVNAAGPDRVSGGQWDVSYAREYYRVVTVEGALVWLFRDAARDRWYLHGWWD